METRTSDSTVAFIRLKFIFTIRIVYENESCRTKITPTSRPEFRNIFLWGEVPSVRVVYKVNKQRE